MFKGLLIFYFALSLILTFETGASRSFSKRIQKFSEDIVGPSFGFHKQEIKTLASYEAEEEKPGPIVNFMRAKKIEVAFRNPVSGTQIMEAAGRVFGTVQNTVSNTFQQAIAYAKTSDQPETGSSIRVFMDESQMKGGDR